MEVLQVIIWMIYPYTVVAILVMGLVWQYDMVELSEDSRVEVKTSQLLLNIISSLSILSIITGLAVIFTSKLTNDPQKLFEWTLSLMRLDPDMNLIMDITILSQIHLLLIFTLLLMLSFTKYVSYLFNPHQYFKHQVVKKINKL